MSSITDYIKVFDGVVPQDVCDFIIQETNQQHERWEIAQTTSGVDDRRLCKNWDVQNTDPIDGIIFEYVNAALNEYLRSFPYFRFSTDHGYQVLKYETGGQYDWHTDQSAKFNREVTIIIGLNDDYEGGRLCYLTDDQSIKLAGGSVAIFPSNFMFPHRITEVTSGTRYSIVSWAV
jgi:predicted 2-oxoglutarate/Fe(II)-dependent dioxygenase YbiX